jgi:hypothetical protein
MPYRTLSIFIAIFGTVIVIALILLGRDLRRAARTGPTWKRRLVTAGLVLLGALGITSGCSDWAGLGGGYAITGASFEDPIPPGRSLDETRHWKHLAATWREAEEIGSGKRGNYPFNERGKKRILDDLATAKSNLGTLQHAGLLSVSEAGLLEKELDLLTSRVQAMRPTEMRNATCYEPMMFTPAQDSLNRLADRLPLLEKLAQSNTVQPQVVAKVLDTVDKDLVLLGKPEMLDRLTDEQKAAAQEVTRAAKSHVEKIRNTLNVDFSALEDQRQWQVVVDAWRAAGPLARSGRSTTAQREAVDKKLDSAKRVVAGLAEAGMLSDAESQLLIFEADRLREQIYREPPIDSKVACYDMAVLLPARQSLYRLNRRLPLLKRLAAEGKLHPAALQKVIDSIKADIDTLSTEEQLKQLPPEERAKAEKLRGSVEAAVVEITRIPEESK